MNKPQKTKLIRSILAATALLGGTLTTGAQAANFNAADTSVQMFRWKWNDIAKECTNYLGPQGYGAVQISPPHAAASLNAWWDIYQPVNFTVLNSAMGTEAELQTMINTCHAAKVRVYVDVVVNHMAAGAGTATNGSTWNSSSLTYPNFSSSDFHPACDIQGGDYGSPGNRNSVMNCRLSGLPDLKTESSYVQGQIKNYLNKLVAMGADGVRFDAAKHMAPADLAAIMAVTNRTTTSGETLWVTQEVIPDSNVVRSAYYGTGTLNEFQFPFAIKAMFRNENGANPAQVRTIMGTPGSWGGTWGFIPSDKASVFVNNWDTERNGSSLVASNFVSGTTNDTNGTKRYDLANIFMLAWPYGHAQVHSGFRFSNSDQAPPSASPFDGSGNPLINQSWDFIHRWSDISNMVAFRAVTSGQGVDNFVSGSGNQIAFGRGTKGFVAINNDSGAAWNASFASQLPAGTYCNVAHGVLNAAGTGCTSDSVVVGSNGIVSVSIPANGGATVPAVALHANQKVTGTGGGGGTCTSVAVKFRVANANTVVGQNVHVAGNRTELGNWTATTNDQLTIESTGANSAWSKTIQLPPATAIQYKFIKHGAVADVWESNQTTSSGNREATTPACGGTLTLDAGSFKF